MQPVRLGPWHTPSRYSNADYDNVYATFNETYHTLSSVGNHQSLGFTRDEAQP